MQKASASGKLTEMSGRIFLINVGTNASHGFCSPIFEDRTFEFLPIPEDRRLPETLGIRYRQLRSFYDPQQDILKYVPENRKDCTSHNDPEFDTFTYGDNCDFNSRAMSLRNVSRGDYLLFISRMELWKEGSATGEYGFYFPGFIHVDEIITSVRHSPERQVRERFSVNAHVRRGDSDSALWDSFWLFGGSSWSQRFYRAVPVTKQLCQDVFRTANGSEWKWKLDRTDLQTIGSYTRSCRCVLDPDIQSDQNRISVLWSWIENHS